MDGGNKKNIFPNKWAGAFSLGSMISYSSGVIFTLLFMEIVDIDQMMWKILFYVSLLSGIIGVCLQSLLFDNDQDIDKNTFIKNINLIEPIKDSLRLLKKNHKFRDFQWAFMIGGLGLMIIKPVLPIYITKTLGLKYADLMVAFCIYKAFGFVLSTPIWSRIIKIGSYNIFLFIIFFTFFLYVTFLSYSLHSLNYLFLGYLIYGIAQAGSHMIWNLSGPLFSENDSSSRYTAVNIFMVGIRGLIGPFIGVQLLLFYSPRSIFLLSSLLFLVGGLFSLKKGLFEKFSEETR